MDPESSIEQMRQNYIYRLFRPYLFLLRISGLFFVQPTALRAYLNKIHTSSNSIKSETPHYPTLPPKIARRWEWFERCSCIYCLVVFGLILFIAGKFFFSFAFAMKGVTLTKATLGSIVSHSAYTIWISQVLLIQFFMLRACCNSGEMFTLFQSFDYLRYNCPLATGDCPMAALADRFYWRRNFILTVAMFHSIPQVASAVLQSVVPATDYAQLKQATFEGFDFIESEPDSPKSSVLVTFAFVAGVYASLIYILPLYFFFMTALLIRLEFSHLTKDLSRCVDGDGAVHTKSLEWFRIRHTALCTWLDVADNIFSPWILLNLTCSTIQILAFIFVVLTATNLQLLTVLTEFFWLLSYITQIVMTMYAGSIVSEAAHSPLQQLYQICQTTLNLPETLHLQTFLNKLTCNRIGFSAWKMFTINHEAIISILGMYVTYQLLLFQLQLDLGLDDKIDVIKESCSIGDSSKLNNSTMSKVA